MIYLKIKTIIILSIIGVCLAHTPFLLSKDKKEASIQTSGKTSMYKILVDVEESKLYLFENEKLKKVYSCSGGKWSTPSPIGTWTIISKAKWGEGFGRKLDGTKCSLGAVPEYMEH